MSERMEKRERKPIDPRYQVTAAGFLFCRDCGSLIMEGYREEHDVMHPTFTCNQLGCGMYHWNDHPWEQIHPRRPRAEA